MCPCVHVCVHVCISYRHLKSKNESFQRLMVFQYEDCGMACISLVQWFLDIILHIPLFGEWKWVNPVMGRCGSMMQLNSTNIKMASLNASWSSWYSEGISVGIVCSELSTDVEPTQSLGSRMQCYWHWSNHWVISMHHQEVWALWNRRQGKPKMLGCLEITVFKSIYSW